MERTYSGPLIPHDVAFQLCAALRSEYHGKWLRPAAWQCWGCATLAGGDQAKLCVSSRPDYRGCQLVNIQYERWLAAGCPSLAALAQPAGDGEAAPETQAAPDGGAAPEATPQPAAQTAPGAL